MPSLIQRLLDKPEQNRALIEAIRHMRERRPLHGNPQVTVVTSWPNWSLKHLKLYEPMLYANTVGAFSIQVEEMDGKLKVSFRIPVSQVEVEEAKDYIGKCTQPQRLVPRGVPAKTRDLASVPGLLQATS